MLNIEQILEFDKLKNRLSEYAFTEAGKKKAEELKMFLSESEVNAVLRQTTEAKTVLTGMGNPPFTSLEGMSEFVEIAQKGGCLTAEQLEYVSVTFTTIKRLKDFLNRAKQLEISLPYYEENLDSLDDVRNEIDMMIRGGSVIDTATGTLRDLRSDIERLEDKMRDKADSALRANKEYLSDSFCTARNGHICLPVKKEYRLKVLGSVIDKSSTGNTLFIEPASVGKYMDDLSMVKLEEEGEVRRILYTLTGMLADTAEIYERNRSTIEKLDFIFAKGKLSMDYDGLEPVITSERKINIQNGRHPLMDKSVNVPLNFSIGEGANGIIITGPNTGGKTVAIKTVGLNCMMAQCGLHVACEKASICLNSMILCDIGDGQNLSENLSTFSAHITNILDILKKVGKESLVILDELGSGTDPTEGMGIAIAVLEELRKSGGLYLVTTHYPEVKNYAEKTEGVLNARMMFDRESLRPLYKLEIGKAGESCAFYIAKKLGMPGNMLMCANRAAYGDIAAFKNMPEVGGKPEDFAMEIDQSEQLKKEHTTKLITEKKKNQSNSGDTGKKYADRFQLGDSVMVFPDKKIGIVCGKADAKGMVRVQMPDKKISINHRRLKLHVSAEELYPADYDFSIIFDSVENRKARHDMDRRYAPEAEIRIEKDNL